LKLLDPGRPDVRDYVTGVIMDVVRRYDIDGVHFDDYFYPYPDGGAGFYGISNEDDQTFASYSRGFTSKADWRRDNVNLLVKMVHDSIQTAKPWVKFGISPFGIWKAGNPPGISGTSAYSAIYCDALTWLNARTVDYLTPQLYWQIGGSQDYAKLMPWWASRINGLHFYPGHAAYRISSWTNREMPNQLRLDRANEACGGSVFFRALNIRDNLKGFTDSLKSDFYRFRAVQPVMTWKDDVVPLSPRNLLYSRRSDSAQLQLNWQAPSGAADGDSARRYLIYHHAMPSLSAGDMVDPAYIVDISYQTSFAPPVPTTEGPHFYTVTSLDHYGYESTAGVTIQVYPPQTPLLASPLQDEGGLADSLALRWYAMESAASFEVQVNTNDDFSGPFFASQAGIVDTFYTIKGLCGQTRYYWRVRPANAGGWGDYSEIRSFVPGSPAVPVLAYPGNNQFEIPVTVPLQWHSVSGADYYRLQVSRNLNFDPSGVVIDKDGIVDTSYVAENLDLNRIYFWRVRAFNQLGTSVWSEIYRFKTTAVVTVAEGPTVPLTLELGQNYPNPFNNLTTIPFTIPAAGQVRIYVYDMLGRRVLTLAGEEFSAGRHKVSFDASKFASGVYVYRLFYDGNILSRRMLYVK
ncbi:family 10 glycosylhydrolase, partial [candidate division KSB1 bacterium]|nr:family 10 glycosylhydrolase [candidate division KSB1 bacterium]